MLGKHSILYLSLWMRRSDNMINIGDHAPEFTMKNENEEDVSRGQFKGKNVLLCFFPFAFSPVCTTEMSCFQDDFSEFNNIDVEILAISVDSHYSLAAFKKSLNANDVTFLSDFSKDMCRRYGMLRPEGKSERAYFFIDKDGIVRWKHVMPHPGVRLENKDLLKMIETHS